MNRQDLADQIIQICKRLYRDKLIIAKDGNVSARMFDKTILATPAGICKGELTQEMLIHLDVDGSVISGKFDPSSEIKMHLAAYDARPDVKAVVHAHPPIATAFACSGIALDKALVAELILTLGKIPLAPYGTPSTHEVPDAVRPLVEKHDGILLANHGALAIGKDLTTAYFNMETIEHFAKISLYARLIGRERPLNKGQLQALVGLMKEKKVANAAIDSGEYPITLDEIAGIAIDD